MIAPIHMAVGAIAQKSTKRWYLWLPLAFGSHQVMDWTNGSIFHDGTPLAVTILLAGVMLVVAWYGRHQWAGMLVAASPDIVDHLPRWFGLTTREWLPIHRFFWSAHWQEPEWAFTWLLVATVVLVLVLRDTPKPT